MTLLIYGFLSEHTSNLMHIADSLPYWAKNSSLYRRFTRFFESRRDLRGIGLFLLDKILVLLKPVFKEVRKVKIYLIIDRHEWHYGKKVNNLLVVSIYIPLVGIGVPIQVLDLDRRGNSSFEERELVLEEVYRKLREYIDKGLVEVEVLGDREFIGEEWEDYIGSRFGGYVIRVRKDYEVKDGVRVGDIFRDMERGEIRDIRRDGWRVIVKKLEEVEGRRDSCLALVTIDMGSEAEEVVERYKDRWKIERMFLNLESNGFRLGKTHLRESSKIEMLFYILSVCYYLSEVAGKLMEIEGVRGRKSVFLKGFRTIKRKLRGILVIEVEKIWELMMNFEEELSKHLPSNLAIKGVQ